MKTLREVVEWIKENRKGCAFKDYPEGVIAQELTQCSIEGTLVITTDEDEVITGVVCASKIENRKVMFIHDVLMTRTSSLKRALRLFIDEWPDYTLEGLARNRKRVFNNPQKLLAKL